MFHVRRMFGGNLAVGWQAALVARHYMDGFVDRLKSAVRVSEDFYSRDRAPSEARRRAHSERHEPDASDVQGR